MDALDMLLVGGIGGGLVIYGAIKRNKTRARNPDSPNAFLREIHEIDPHARQEGNFALGLGLIMLLGALFFH